MIVEIVEISSNQVELITLFVSMSAAALCSECLLMPEEAFKRQILVQRRPMETKRRASVAGAFGRGCVAQRSVVGKVLTRLATVLRLYPNGRIC